jgi:hypothetical protein
MVAPSISRAFITYTSILKTILVVGGRLSGLAM